MEHGRLLVWLFNRDIANNIVEQALRRVANARNTAIWESNFSLWAGSFGPYYCIGIDAVFAENSASEYYKNEETYLQNGYEKGISFILDDVFSKIPEYNTMEYSTSNVSLSRYITYNNGSWNFEVN